MILIVTKEKPLDLDEEQAFITGVIIYKGSLSVMQMPPVEYEGGR